MRNLTIEFPMACGPCKPSDFKLPLWNYTLNKSQVELQCSMAGYCRGIACKNSSYCELKGVETLPSDPEASANDDWDWIATLKRNTTNDAWTKLFNDPAIRSTKLTNLQNAMTAQYKEQNSRLFNPDT